MGSPREEGGPEAAPGFMHPDWGHRVPPAEGPEPRARRSLQVGPLPTRASRCPNFSARDHWQNTCHEGAIAWRNTTAERRAHLPGFRVFLTLALSIKSESSHVTCAQPLGCGNKLWRGRGKTWGSWWQQGREGGRHPKTLRRHECTERVQGASIRREDRRQTRQGTGANSWTRSEQAGRCRLKLLPVDPLGTQMSTGHFM